MTVDIDQFETTLNLSNAFGLLPIAAPTNNHGYNYNSRFRDNGYHTTPAKWRMDLCNQIEYLLSNKTVQMEFIMQQLQKHLNNERYGFNGDLIITLAKHNAPINKIIVFRGVRCTLLHAIVTVCGGFNLSLTHESFHHYLIRNKPMIDVRDEYGRTALVIAVWNVSPRKPNINEVNVIRCLLEYGFDPSAKHRGITVMQKLAKICDTIKETQREIHGRNQSAWTLSKAAQRLLETYDQVKHFRERASVIQASLKSLVHKAVIVDDIADVIQDCVGISNYTKKRKPRIKRNSNRLLKQRMKFLSATFNGNFKLQIV